MGPWELRGPKITLRKEQGQDEGEESEAVPTGTKIPKISGIKIHILMQYFKKPKFILKNEKQNTTSTLPAMLKPEAKRKLSGTDPVFI